MKSDPDRIDDLQDRLLRLEKQNRRLKQVGVGALMIPALLLLMGQGASKKTVEANEFILRDPSGNVRARLSVQLPLDIPKLELFDDQGRPSVALSGSLTPIGGTGAQGGGVVLYDSQGRERGSFLASDSQAYLRIADVNGALKATVGEKMIIVEDGAIVARDAGKDLLTAMIGGEVSVSDGQGFQTIMGTANLVTPRTGETHNTSAASLVMFDKQRNVIWKAP